MGSFDSGQRPLTNQNYQSANNPYGSGDPYYQQSSGFLPPQRPKKGTSGWIKFGIPVAILIIIGVVVGVAVGVTHNNNSKSAASSNNNNPTAAANSAINAKTSVGLFPISTDSEFMVPVYPSTTNTAAFTTPTIINSDSANIAWPQDPFQPANPSPTNVRTDRPRLIAPSYKWEALPNLIAHDPYLQYWNETIFGNATTYYPLPPVVYHLDGGNGILDNSREIKMRLKAFSYVYRMTNDTKWVDRAWAELQNAAGNGTSPFGPDTDKWNSAHFLDTAEMTAAFGIAYDWLYDVWTDDQKAEIRSTMIEFGLSLGINAFTNMNIGWWSNEVEGNWNCVCNGGLTVGALAILNDDTTGTAEQILALTVPNALSNCIAAVANEGTWSETANYWYFGTTGWAEMTSSLITATGSDFGLLHNNPNFNATGLYHMYVTGQTSLFNYGDHGPNKFSTTANSLIFLTEQYGNPMYALFQRDRDDAAEPWSMFWYDPRIAGAFWDGTPLDMFFDNVTDQWASMRSSWTDQHGLYVAAKAGMPSGAIHQNHNDLDCGDFVIDALGTRWAGEYGSGDYLATGYFDGTTQEGQRWLYYRKRTEGQNVILVNGNNQNIDAVPSVQHDTSGTAQGSSTVFSVPDGSTAYWIADLSTAYNDTSSYSRGIRLINNRKQVLVQDEITTTAALQWRIHTNATVTVNGATATLNLDGQSLTMQILNPPSGATFGTADPVRLSTDPPLPDGQVDQPNPGVTVVTIDLPAGTYSLQVLFNPQWPGMSSSDFATPPSVALSDWTLTSHN